MAWTSPRTWVAGEDLTASLLNTHVRDNLKAIGDTWTGYSPSWTAASVNPAIGNGSLVGDFMQAGKFVNFRAVITMGSTTTYGTGQWRITLPVAAVSHLWVFAAELRDTGTAAYEGRGVNASTYLELFCPPTTAGNADRSVSSTVPFTWGTGDILAIAGTYQAA